MDNFRNPDGIYLLKETLERCRSDRNTTPLGS